MKTLLWSVRRELWENRSVYVAPLAVGGIVLVGFTIALIGLPGRIQAATAIGDAELRAAVQQPYVAAALVLMFVEMVVAVVYCIDALYGERRDRSILFWKSLPVSDLTTVLAKASIPILVLPLLTFGLTMITQAVMLLASSAVLSAAGTDAAVVRAQVPLLDLARINLVHLLTFHGLWWAPLYAWLLLVSAWASRVPFLWAALPLVAVGILERIAFNTTRFVTLLQDYLLGGPVGKDGGGMTLDMLAPHPLLHLLTRPALAVGLVLAAIFVLGAARLRRASGPI